LVVTQVAIAALGAVADKSRTEHICSRRSGKALAVSASSARKDADGDNGHPDSAHSSLVVSRFAEELATHGIALRARDVIGRRVTAVAKNVPLGIVGCVALANTHVCVKNEATVFDLE
jgi:hypothetical protein